MDLVGESSYRDALRQEGTTRPKELSPESGHSHQTCSTGEPLLWHLGPKDKPILDEGFEASTSSEQAERWNRFKNYGNRRSLENVVNPEVPPSASSQISNTFFTPSPWQVQGPTNPLWPVAGAYQYEQDIFDEDEAPLATDYSTSPDERRPKNPVNPSDESTLTNPILPRLEPTKSPLVTPAHSKSGASNPTKTVKQKKTVSKEGKEDEQVEKYFRELKRLKTIYDWTADHLLNMTLLGLKGRADDWAGALPDADKDTFDKLETQMVKIFGDRRAKWQKHSEFCSLKQGKDQSVIEFDGGLKQKQIKAEASDSMMLAVFLEGLKQTIARQVAIMDPKTFTEAVDCATRLESLDKGKAGSKISNAVSELGGNDEESGEASLESVNERFGIVLARLEAAPWFQKPRQGQGEPAQTSSGYRQQGYERKAGYDNQKGGRIPDQRPKTGKAQGAQAKGGTGDQPAFKRERQKLTYDESKYCIIHQQHGHATDACLWLKNRLKEKPPRMYKDDRERKGENKEQGN